VLVDHLTRLDKTSRNALYVTLLVIAGVGMYSWIVSPHVKYLQAVQKYRPAIEKIIDKQSDIKRKLVGRRSLLEKLKKRFNDVGSTLHTTEQMQQLFGELGAVAEQYGCSLAKVDLSTDDPEVIIGAVSDPSYVESIKAGLTVLGDFAPLVAYVDCLQNQEHKIWINSLDIKVLKDAMLQEQDSVLKCDIALEIFVMQKKEKEVAPNE
jgi:hypothetical protein